MNRLKMKWLLYGARGWLGSQFSNYLREKFPSITLLTSDKRVDDIDTINEELNELKPDRVICFIGRTSGPGCNTIDYLEGPGKLVENIHDNLFAPVILMKLCEIMDIHCTYLGTGCIFSYNDPEDPPFTERSKPNFTGSSYSTVKGFTDQLAGLFPALNVRIRMPITSKDEPKNLLSKMIRYPKICNTLNSVSVLDDIFPALFVAISNKHVGTINLVNPGPIDHVTILELYKKHVDPNHTYTLMEESEQNNMLQSKRAKNTMKPTFEMPTAKESIERIFQTFTKV